MKSLKVFLILFFMMFISFALVGCNEKKPEPPIENVGGDENGGNGNGENENGGNENGGNQNGGNENGGNENGGNENGGNENGENNNDETPATLTSLSISTENVKLSYYVGEEFNENGILVTGHYSDGSTKDLTAYIFIDSSSFKSDEAGTYTITVTYMTTSVTKTVTYDVTVEEELVLPSLDSLKLGVENVKVDYLIGEEFDGSGITCEAIYTDESTSNVTSEIEIDSSNFNKDVEGTYIIKVKYSELDPSGDRVIELEASYTVKVTAPIVEVTVVDLSSAALAAKQGDRLVNAGEATIHYIREAYSTDPENYEFLIGNNYFRVTDYDQTVSHFTSYLDKNNVLQLYGVGVSKNNVEVDPLHTVTSVEGWTITPFGTSGFKNEKLDIIPCVYTGAGGVVKGLYDLSQLDVAYNVVMTEPDEINNFYGIRFEVLLDDSLFGHVQQFYYYVDLKFTLNDNQVCDSLELRTEYINEDWFTVNEDGTVTVEDGATHYAKTDYTIKQYEGDRIMTSPYQPSFREDEKLTVSGRIMLGRDNKGTMQYSDPVIYQDGDIIVLTVGKNYVFKAENSEYEVTAKCVYDKNCGPWGDAAISVTSFGGEVWLNCFNVSEFTHRIVFTYDTLETVIYIQTVYLPVTSFGIDAFIGVGEPVPTRIKLEDGYQVKVNTDFNIFPYVNNGAQRDISVELVSGGECTILPGVVKNNGMDVFIFTPSELGEYVIKFIPNEAPELAQTVTLNVVTEVVEPTDFSGLIATGKKYTAEGEGYNLSFSFRIEGVGDEPFVTMTGTGPDGETYNHSYYISFNKYTGTFNISQDYPEAKLDVVFSASGTKDTPVFTITLNGVTLTLN